MPENSKVVRYIYKSVIPENYALDSFQLELRDSFFHVKPLHDAFITRERSILYCKCSIKAADSVTLKIVTHV